MGEPDCAWVVPLRIDQKDRANPASSAHREQFDAGERAPRSRCRSGLRIMRQSFRRHVRARVVRRGSLERMMLPRLQVPRRACGQVSHFAIGSLRHMRRFSYPRPAAQQKSTSPTAVTRTIQCRCWAVLPGGRRSLTNPEEIQRAKTSERAQHKPKKAPVGFLRRRCLVAAHDADLTGANRPTTRRTFPSRRRIRHLRSTSRITTAAVSTRHRSGWDDMGQSPRRR